MSLKRSARKNHLNSEYKRYRSQAETARNEGHYQKAARYYKQCVETLEELAELEQNDQLRAERLELAENLATAAEQLEEGQPLTDSQADTTDTVEDSYSKRSDKAESTQSDTADSGADTDADATSFLQEPPDILLCVPTVPT